MLFRSELPFHVRIESPASPGVPDVYWALGNGVNGWMELKVVPDTHRAPLRAGTSTGELRPLQVLWAKNATEKNIFTTVLLFHKNRAILVAGGDVERLLGATLDTVLEAALWVGEPTPRNRWHGLQEKLDKHGKQTTLQLAAEGS